jgi:hypothetical protein
MPDFRLVLRDPVPFVSSDLPFQGLPRPWSLGALHHSTSLRESFPCGYRCRSHKLDLLNRTAVTLLPLITITRYHTYHPTVVTHERLSC